ncbi:DUF6662 family protein [Bdellovibrio svalbardensis]|uniref:Uncharacterized protein n=1 Tax=Bdellovibrio svalbardensis TaxID=2972972 RepID=A0ABT6DMT4_9BACT|nr:DUF6662 family protein [Bdellovibrio svalbardensis]MDG0818182.1 hypothetical protein [Bdellovibrio svalbardensis]
MSKFNAFKMFAAVMAVCLTTGLAQADENLFGYIRGAETLPQGSWDLYQVLTSRTDKGKGTYSALDSKTEIEYGATNSLSISGALMMQSIYSSGITVDAYIPKDINSGMSPSGLEFSAKYNFLSPAKDDVGFSTYFALLHSWRDKHSGQDKDSTSAELEFILQKYFLEGELIWVLNTGMESTYAQRYYIPDLDPGFEWPTHPEMEIALNAGMGLSYRFMPNWFVGAELSYETEYETEVGQERWSTFAGPNLHYATAGWWTTLTWFPQIQGAPAYDGQQDANLHLIEKTKQEVRFKVGINF